MPIMTSPLPVWPKTELPRHYLIHGVQRPDGSHVIEKITDRHTGEVIWKQGDEEHT